MKLIVGLGNPGKKYVGTRHNVGFMVVDRFAENTRWKKSKVVRSSYIMIEEGKKKVELMKPEMYMNRSGEVVEKVVRFYKVDLDDLYIVHDDLDIPLGKYKIQLGKGSRQHKGLESIYKELRGKEFWHIRIGIENRSVSGGEMISGEEYVLQRFTQEEREIVDRVVKNVIEDLYQRLYKI